MVLSHSSRCCFATVLLALLATRILSGKKAAAGIFHANGKSFSRRNGRRKWFSGYPHGFASIHQDRTAEELCDAADSLTRGRIKTEIFFSGVMGPIMKLIGNVGLYYRCLWRIFSING